MTQEQLSLEAFLWNSFCDGQRLRELRLSAAELSTLQAFYPSADCQRCTDDDSLEKAWYRVQLSPCSA